jgi:hypothetical protein
MSWAESLRTSGGQEEVSVKTFRVIPSALSVLLGIAVLAGFGITGCGDDDPTQTPEDFAPPTNLVASNGDEQITVRWSPSPDEGLSEFKRYNVYRGTSSLLGTDAGQLEQLGYKIGSVNAGVDSLRSTVANGTRYYFHVRAEKDDGGLSGASNESRPPAVRKDRERSWRSSPSDGDSGFDFSAGSTVSLNRGHRTGSLSRISTWAPVPPTMHRPRC